MRASKALGLALIAALGASCGGGSPDPAGGQTASAPATAVSGTGIASQLQSVNTLQCAIFGTGCDQAAMAQGMFTQVQDCTIPAGASSCTASVSYVTARAANPVLMLNGSAIFTGASAASLPVQVSPNGGELQLWDGATLLDQTHLGQVLPTGPGVVVTATLDASSGGSVTVSNPANPLNGTVVTVPAGALGTSGSDSISVGYSNELPGAIDPTAIAAGAKVASKTITLAHAASASFAAPITVTIPYDKSTVGADDIPVVVYWNPALGAYEPVQVAYTDRAAGTVTFSTMHFSSFVTIFFPGLYAMLTGATPYPNLWTSLDTGYRPDTDGFAAQNFSTETNATARGACYGLTSFSAWYYSSEKPSTGPLYTTYNKPSGTLPANPIEDDVARELIFKTFLDTLQFNLATNILSVIGFFRPNDLGADITVLAEVVSQMMLTHRPQMLALFQNRDRSKLGAGHSVLAYAWVAPSPSSPGGFLIYDPNAPAAPQKITWDAANRVFATYTSPAAFGNPLTYSLVLHDAWTSYFDPDVLLNDFNNAQAAWPDRKFSDVTILSTSPPQSGVPALPAGTYALDRSSPTTFYAGASGPMIDPHQQTYANIYVDDLWVTSQPINSNGNFSFTLDSLAPGKPSAELLVILSKAAAKSSDQAYISYGYAGVLRATLVPTLPTLSVTVNGTGSGSVASSPAGISCPGTCVAAFPASTPVTLTPAAADGSSFTGWSGACSGSGTCTVPMNAAATVTATFDVASPGTCSNGGTDYPTCTPPGGGVDGVSPGAESIGTAGGCSGGTLSGSFTVTAPNGVTWSAAVDPNNLPPLGGGTVVLGGGSGSGGGAFTVTVNVPPQPPSSSYSSCSLNWYLDTFTNVWVTFSDGAVIGVTAYWTFKGTT